MCIKSMILASSRDLLASYSIFILFSLQVGSHFILGIEILLIYEICYQYVTTAA